MLVPVEALNSSSFQVYSTSDQSLGETYRHSQTTLDDVSLSTMHSAKRSEVLCDLAPHRPPRAIQPAVGLVHETRSQVGAESIALPTGSICIPESNSFTGSNTAQNELKPTFKCEVEGCKAKSFKRNTELQRHKLKHSGQRYSCPAQGCKRHGVKGFYRSDKLNDHILAGHDDDTFFACPHCSLSKYTSELSGASQMLTRDVLSVHLRYNGSDPNLDYLNMYRVCPIPRCPFRIHVAFSHGETLDPLQLHLLKHDQKGRTNFRTKVLERGYDVITGDIICPMCKAKFPYPGHSNFRTHLGTIHSIRANAGDPEESYLHRRTILSLCPMFAFSSVWDDVSCRQFEA